MLSEARATLCRHRNTRRAIGGAAAQSRAIGRSLIACMLCVAMTLAIDELAVARDGVLPSVRSRATRQDLRRPPDVPSDTDLETAHARIGAVTIEPRNIFDPSRPDEDTALFRLADRLHVRTRVATV